MTLESWQYGNPEGFMDRQIARTAAEKKREAIKREQHRKHRARRIASLTKQAMKKGGGNAR